MKTLSKKQMWYVILIAIAAALLYAYSIRNSIKVAPPKKEGCGSCPMKQASLP